MRTVIPILLFCVVLLVRPVSAQQVPSPTPAPAEPTFISIDGEFQIDLPSRANGGASTLAPVAGESTGGALWKWNLPDGRRYQISFLDRVFSEDVKDTILDRTADKLIADMAKSGQTVLDRKSFKFKEHDAIEVRITVDSGTAVARYILVNKRLYMLTTGWPLGKVSDPYLKPFDSFDLIDRKTAVAKCIEEATPDELPQLPKIKLASTDAQMERLRGKVKIVSVSKKFIEGTSNATIQSNESHFDEHGNLVKIVSFDHRGNPRNVSGYGFIDGKRVEKSGKYLSYEYDPPPPPPMRMPPPASTGSASVVAAPPPRPAEPPKKGDTRYGVEYNFKFDPKDRLIEKISLNNRGDVFWREVYRPDGNSTEKTQYSNDGKLMGRSITEFDERGNETKETKFSTSTTFPNDSVFEYRYLKFDRKGNWIEREVSGKAARYKGGTDSFRYVESREITYY